MGHTPYGYSIENGCAAINKDEADKIRKLYENYLSGMALAKAASAAGIETYHGTAKRLMENRHYLGDDFDPAIIVQETFDKAAAVRLERAGAFCGAERTPMRFRADAMRNITDAPKRSIKLLNFSAGSLLCNASSPA